MAEWIDACDAQDVEKEDLIGFDHAGRRFAVYRAPGGAVHCTDGLCTHENVRLEDGLVMDHVIECPMHNGQFDYRTGEALRAPACEALATYPAKEEGGRILVMI